MRDYSPLGPALGMLLRLMLLHLKNQGSALYLTSMLGFLSPERQAQQQYFLRWRPSPLLAGSILSLVVSLSMGGCYWLKYNKLMRTHVELLLSMADKMQSVLEAEQPLAPTMMNEFIYPLDRARDFARIVGRRYAERQSFRSFVRFLDIYEQLVQEADRLRVLKGDLAHFHAHVTTLREHATQVEAALAEEER